MMPLSFTTCSFMFYNLTDEEEVIPNKLKKPAKESEKRKPKDQKSARYCTYIYIQLCICLIIYKFIYLFVYYFIYFFIY